MEMNEVDKRKVEEFKRTNGDFDKALMEMWSLHNQEIQELRKMYMEVVQENKRLKGELNGV